MTEPPRTHAASLLAILALTAAPAAAQTPPDTFRLDPIVVTATRLPAPRASVPAAVTVLDGEALRRRGIRFVADALRDVPGATVARNGSEGGLTSLFLRGGESDYVQVMVDGIVMNDPGGAFDFGQLTTDNVERIEVLRGPASVLYGSDAVTGVVHIVTRRGEGAPRVHASAGVGQAPRLNGETAVCPGYPATPCAGDAELGSYTKRSWDAGVAGGAGAVAYSLGVSGYDGDGAYAFNNDYRNRAVSARAGVERSRFDAAVTGRYTDGTFHFPTNGAGSLVDGNQFRSSESAALGVDAGFHAASWLEARALLTFHEGDYVVDDAPDSPVDTLGSYQSLNESRTDRSKADLAVHLRPARDVVVTVGGEVERQRGSSAFTSMSQFGPFESASYNERTNRAAYAQAMLPVSSLTVTAGARTEDNDRFGTFGTWRAGANLRIADGTLLRVAAGTGFKEPTFFENYAEGFTRGNPELEPEESRSREVGAEQQLANGRVRLGATWFDQRFTNLIQYTAQPATPGSPNYTNIGEAKAMGLELEAVVALPSGLHARAGWTLLDTEVLDEGIGADRLFQQGEALVRRPRHRADVQVSAPFGERVSGGASFGYVGERDDLDFLEDFNGTRVLLPAYTTVDAFAEVRVLGDAERSLALHARVENLFDADVMEIANFPSRGRSVFLGLRGSTGF